VVASVVFLIAVLRISAPYAMAAMGGLYSEGAGVVQLGLEGFLLVGASATAIAALATGSATAGILIALACGAIVALAYGLLVVVWRGNQVVCGVALNLFADAVSRFTLKLVCNSSSNSPRVPALDNHFTPFMLLTFAVVLASCHYAYRYRPFGLRLRAAGESPDALAAVGVSVRRVRLMAVVVGGVLASAGGAYLAVEQRQFVAGMAGGRGYIALAALIIGGWRPVPAILASLLFGAAEAIQISLQTAGVIDLTRFGWALQLLPYALTVAVLAGFGRKHVRAPRALGTHS
jgi:ABC-type uncharacterized transport system permease subunit